MKNLLIFCFFAFSVTFTFSQTYTHPTVGVAGEYVGGCMINTCGGTYTDDGGGGGGFYSNSVNAIYQTFCPNAPGMCLKVTFNSIDFHNSNCIPGNVPCDVLNIINGATQNDPTISQINYGDDGTTPSFTSTSTSGCLSFRFSSSSANNAAGWSATFSCVACTANSGTANVNTDACSATNICGNASFAGSSVGPGLTSDGCAGCNNAEHYTNWYYFCISTGGNLNLVINPTPSSQDYDYALYGPSPSSCSNLGTPVRCSYAASTGNTGLGNGAVDLTENVSGNGWTAPLTVNAGECYYLMVNKWDAGGQGFTVNFTGSTASLDCIVLPVELSYMQAGCLKGNMLVEWETASEANSSHFILEKSLDGKNFVPIKRFEAQGFSTTATKYVHYDVGDHSAFTYYRLVQYDRNGKRTVHNPVQAMNNCAERVKGELSAYSADGMMTLNYYSDADGAFELSLLDSQGREVFSRTADLTKGSNKQTFPTDVAEGIYYLRLANAGIVNYCKVAIHQ